MTLAAETVEVWIAEGPPREGRSLVVGRLAEYLERPSDGIRLEDSPGGKPRLRREPGDADLRFSLSHSWGLTVLAFAVGREVGIDIERVRPGVDWETIAGRLFRDDDPTRLRGADVAAFFGHWVGLEALGKAAGQGVFETLAAPPDGDWTRIPLEMPASYVGCVAIEGVHRCSAIAPRPIPPQRTRGAIVRADS